MTEQLRSEAKIYEGGFEDSGRIMRNSTEEIRCHLAIDKIVSDIDIGQRRLSTNSRARAATAIERECVGNDAV